MAGEEPQPFKTYPVQLGLAYLLLVGYGVRSIFVSFGWPASVGVILSGWLFSYFIQDDIFFGRDMLQELSFFLVLLTAGLSISLPSLTWHHFVLAMLPCTLELVAVALYAKQRLNYTWAEGLNLGTVLVAIGDGLVIPKMKEFHHKYPEHPMPYLMLRWAPLEACYALALFGVFTSLSAPASMPDLNVFVQITWTVSRIVATLIGGWALGTATGIFIKNRGKEADWVGRPIFDHRNPVEAFLIILAVALIAYGLGSNSPGSPMALFGMGPLFHPELMVIVYGSTFAAALEGDEQVEGQESQTLLDEVENIMGGMLVFGQLVLFTMIGSKTNLSIFPNIVTVLPIMAVGLVVRFLGVLATLKPMDLATFQVPNGRQAEPGEVCSMTWHDCIFCFLACLPRATIQGALGAVPVNQRFFQDVGYEERSEAREFIFTAARLYIFCFAIFGMIALNRGGTMILEEEKQERERRRRQLVPNPPSELEPEAAQPAQTRQDTPSSQSTYKQPPAARNSASNVSSQSKLAFQERQEQFPQIKEDGEGAELPRSSSQLAVDVRNTDPGPDRFLNPPRPRHDTDPSPRRQRERKRSSLRSAQMRRAEMLNQFDMPPVEVARTEKLQRQMSHESSDEELHQRQRGVTFDMGDSRGLLAAKYTA